MQASASQSRSIKSIIQPQIKIPMLVGIHHKETVLRSDAVNRVYLSFICFLGVTTHRGGIFTAR